MFDEYKLDIEIPDKLSDWILLALADFEDAEQAADATIDMNDWCIVENNKCRVCLAGSVIRNHYPIYRNVGFKKSYKPCEFDNNEDCALFALNYIREGRVRIGTTVFYHPHIDHQHQWLPDYIDVPEYQEHPEEFKQKLREIAQLFADHGY